MTTETHNMTYIILIEIIIRDKKKNKTEMYSMEGNKLISSDLFCV